MSRLYSAATKLTYEINRFRGLNQSADGNVNIKTGEAVVCRNYRITDEGALKVRGGFKHIFGNHPSLAGTVRYMTSGTLGGSEIIVAVIGDKVWVIDDLTDLPTSYVGELSSAVTKPHAFFYGGNVYVLDGNGGYYRYDGSKFTAVDGYIPTIMIATSPSGAGTLYEQVNKLTSTRKVRYSADGTSTEYFIPEDMAVSIVGVTVNGTEKFLTTDYTFTQRTQYSIHAKIKFNTAPLSGNDNIEVIYSATPDQMYRANIYETASGRVKFAADGTPITAVTQVDGLNAAGTQWRTLVGGASELSEYTVSGNVVTLKTPTDWSIVKVYYTIGNYRSEVTGMSLSEIYNGAQDSRIFLYGNGTNKAIYSGLLEDGSPSAEYFPDLNEMTVGDKNTPITAMIRHRSRLLAFKPRETYSVYYNAVTLADSTLTAGFYVNPINRDVGCSVMGGACLVGNTVRTIDYNNIYEWKATTTSGNITTDARNAEVVSERVKTAVKAMNMSKAVLYYDNAHREFYCADSATGVAVVQNTEADAWYTYSGMKSSAIAYAFDRLLFLADDGRVFAIDEAETQDGKYTLVEGVATLQKTDIQADWRSGKLHFGKPNYVKYTPNLWVTGVTAPLAEVGAILIPDNANTYPSVDLDFANATAKPVTHKAKLKARKFSFLQLGFTTVESGAHALILSAMLTVLADIPVKR